MAWTGGLGRASGKRQGKFRAAVAHGKKELVSCSALAGEPAVDEDLLNHVFSPGARPRRKVKTG